MRYKSLPYSVRTASDEGRAQRPSHQPTPPTGAHRLRDVLATIPLVLILPALLLPFISVRASVGGALIASPQELAVLPTSGAAWTYLKGVADGDLGIANLTDQDDKHDVRTLAVALVANRLDSTAYRDKARAAILSAMGTEQVGAPNSILALGRQLGAYVLAADLIGMSGPDDDVFRRWLSAIRTEELGGHGRYTSLKGTCEDSPHNWGTFACASLLAANLYLGDSAAVARSWDVFRGLTGDRTAYAGFQDLSSDVWACPGAAFTPDNSGCPTDAVRYGAFVKDVTRGSDPPTADGAGLSYTLEILQGVALQAELLSRAGHADAWARLRPAFDWARRNGVMDLSSVGYHVTWWANARLGWSLPTHGALMGRVFGYTDWLYGSPTSGTVPVPTPSPTPAATAKPTTAPTPTLAPRPSPTPAPTVSATATATAVAPSPTATPAGTAVATATPAPVATPTPVATVAPTATPVQTPAPTPDPTAAPKSIGDPGNAGARVVAVSEAQEPDATTIEIAAPDGIAAGDVVVAAIDTRGRPSIDAPSGWQRLRLDSSGTTATLATYLRVAGSAEPSSYVWKLSRSSAVAAIVVAVRGASTDPLADSDGQANAKSSAIAAPAATADRDASLVLAFFSAARATSITSPSGMDESAEISAAAGRYKTTLELSLGAADRGKFEGPIARADAPAISLSQILVLRP